MNWSRELGYDSINFDLIFGLPFQTEESINGVSVINMAGQTVKIIETNGSEKTILNVSDLSAGIYLVQIETSSDITIKRVVIQ